MLRIRDIFITLTIYRMVSDKLKIIQTYHKQ
jgi:hypothetical protein